MASKFYAIIAGVGGGTGRSLALRFSATYLIVLLSRSSSSFDPIVSEINAAGGCAIGVDTDVTDSVSVSKAFEKIRAEMGDRKLAAAVYNVGGAFVRKPFLELTEREFRAGFESNGLGLYNFARNTLPLLLASASASASSSPPYPPTLLVTGATASLRGSALSSSFASGKFSLRALAQSLAREFGPKGVHVAHAIIDGVIDTPRAKGLKFNDGVEDSKLSPDGIADSYWFLHTQSRSTWTQELDIRPYVEVIT